MEKVMLLIMILSGMNKLGCSLSPQYHFININKTWYDAQSYCRLNNTDLATVKNTDNMVRLTATVYPGFAGKAWIGLNNDKLNGWEWSLEDSAFYGPGETKFRNWSFNQGNNYYINENCVAMHPSLRMWWDFDCQYPLPFVCYDGRQNASQRYVPIRTAMTWFDAQSYCRQNHTDLVSIRNQTENQATPVFSCCYSWIGLHRTKLWSDGSNSTFTNWSPGEPNNYGVSCVTVWMGDSGRWTDEDCTTTRPFFCYSVLKTTTAAPTVLPTTTQRRTTILPSKRMVGVKVKISSAAPLTNANITDEVVQQLREELIRRGLPRDIKLHLKPVTVNSTQP